MEQDGVTSAHRLPAQGWPDEYNRASGSDAGELPRGSKCESYAFWQFGKTVEGNDNAIGYKSGNDISISQVEG
ncbi:hypothetical protein [Heliomarina baculiformis]|uniref:hypothetical protein n=1 Tax=Heliomarina baculiformis TaxID=2872036 RepID=UPI001EE25D56|nr:hypothetical protein [Heliomarina baculiformis]